LNPIQELRFQFSGKLMFPNSQDAPRCSSQSLIHKFIPSFVARQFAPPKSDVALRLSSMFRTTMPKTTVNKNSQPVFVKSKIWFSR
jgi:hypothetical protein